MSKLILILIISTSAFAQMQRPVIQPVRTEEPPKIDGRLDDPCWQKCNPASDFYMVEPNPGAPVTQATEVYICYNDEKIFFGIHMSEAKTDKIQAAVNNRDGGVYMDDSFEIMIDSYCDRRNAYYFMSNLIGTKLDGRIIDEGRNIDATWDGHWEVKAKTGEDSWEMEIAIPFSELSFPSGDTLTWGINFWRIERPHWENTSWSKIDRWCQVSKYGTLVNLTISPKIKRFEFLPYAAGRYERIQEDSLKADAGIDVEYDITSNLIFSGTLWPDFAQIEADPFQFNLSYQEGEELYFPEKRPFFLEGGSILNTPINLFYTRRMNEILAGGKIYGKIKSTELLVLDVATEDTDENFSVARVKQELFGTTTLGALATHKQNSNSFSQAGAIDFNQPIYGPFNLTTQFGGSRNTGISGDQCAGHLGVEGETGTYGGGLYASRTGSDFWVAQGFIDIYDINKQGIDGWVWTKFIQDTGWFEWIDGGTAFDVQQEIGDDLAIRDNEFWINFVTRPKLRISFNGNTNYERYGEEEFTNRGIRFEFETNVGGAEGVAGSYFIGRLYDSDLKQGHIGVLFQPLRRLSVFPVLIFLRWDDAAWRWLTNTKISYQVTDRAFVRLFLQAESEWSSEIAEALALQDIKTLNSNFLIGYEFAPGTILYLVYNQLRDFEFEDIDHIFVTKFTYAIRI